MIHLTNISKQYGSQILYQNASFQLQAGEKVGLVGPNGAGKSTVFRVIMGEEGVDSGDISKSEQKTIGYFSQNVAEMRGRTALEEVMQGAGRVSQVQARIQDLEQKLSSADLTDDDMMKFVEQLGEAQMAFENMGGYDLESRAQAILTGLGIGPKDYTRPVESFSGGWKMRIELAKILAQQPDALLMDEPTNHLDFESIVWLEEWLKNYKGALLLTSHDRDFMNRLVKRVVEVASKNITSYSGNYDFYLSERELRRKQLIAAHQKQQDMLAKEEEFIARFAARASHAAQVQSRVKKLEKIDRIEIPPDERTIRFEFPTPPRSGNDVIRFKNLGHEYTRPDGSIVPVFKNLTGHVSRLDRVAVIGVNGAGKSTLLKIMSGHLDPKEGSCDIGASVQMGYFSQSSLDVLDPSMTIYDTVHSRVPGATLGFVRNLLGAFLFSGDDIYKKVGILSGGEKSRVLLSTLMVNPNNLLILDEPTNHLDLASREMLLEALKRYEGTVVFVSHDRYFLRTIATRIFEVDHGGLTAYGETYEEYAARYGHVGTPDRQKRSKTV